MPAYRTALLLLPLLAIIACASNPSPAGAASDGAVVSIDNQSAYDMDIYVHQQGGVVRLGFAPAQEVTRFRISPAFIAGSGILQFEARAKPSGHREVSDPFTVHPGDELSWSVTPQ